MWPFGRSAKDRLLDALKEQELTARLDLDVSVERKVAKVSGEVPNERYKNLITAIANGINGIEGVDLSGIRVAPGAASGQPGTGGVMEGVEDAAGAAGQAAATAGRAVDAVTGGDGDLDAPSGRAIAALERIRGEPSLADNPIDVLQRGTTIVLRGAVDSEAELGRAKELAVGVPGVTGVDVSGLQMIAHASQLNVTDDDGDVVYTVQPGDTLSEIAQRYYGSGGRASYMKIAEANAIADPNLIRVGQKLKIPGTTAGPEARLA